MCFLYLCVCMSMHVCAHVCTFHMSVCLCWYISLCVCVCVCVCVCLLCLIVFPDGLPLVDIGFTKLVFNTSGCVIYGKLSVFLGKH